MNAPRIFIYGKNFFLLLLAAENVVKFSQKCVLLNILSRSELGDNKMAEEEEVLIIAESFYVPSA